MSKLKTIALMSLSILAAPAALGLSRVVNECPHELFVAKGNYVAGGADCIGCGGSWSQVSTEGWWRVGPYQSLDVQAQLLRIHSHRGTVMTNPNTNAKGCLNRSSAFNYLIWTSDNTGTHTVDPVVDCLGYSGASWGSFENVQSIGTYTVYSNSCDD